MHHEYFQASIWTNFLSICRSQIKRVGINCSKFDCSTINWLTLLARNQLLDTKFINCSNPVNHVLRHALSDHSFKYCFTNLMKVNRTSSSKVTLNVPVHDAEILIIPVAPVNRVSFVTVSTSFSPETEPGELWTSWYQSRSISILGRC